MLKETSSMRCVMPQVDNLAKEGLTMCKPRVCVTGLGVVAPNGVGRESFWDSLYRGISGISRISLFDASQLHAQIAGEVKNFDPAKYLAGTKKWKRLARHTQFSLVAANEAISDAGLDLGRDLPSYPIPVVMGVSTSAFDVIYRSMQTMTRFGLARATPFVVTEALPQAPAAAIANHFGINARIMTASSACPAGLDAIAQAVELIRSEKADIAIAGGTDAPISPVPFAILSAAGLASARNDEPGRASRPFDQDRDTGVISEGAGVVILENLEHALARGAQPYMELTGYGVQVDDDPETPGSGLKCTMRAALANAGQAVSAVDYVCAHGPSHPVLDRVETAMIKEVFGRRAYSIPVSSIKGVLGNPLAAAGPIQVIACALAFRNGLVPPTANLETADPECDLDYVPGQARRARLQCAIVNAHGIGGGNSSMVLQKVS